MSTSGNTKMLIIGFSIIIIGLAGLGLYEYSIKETYISELNTLQAQYNSLTVENANLTAQLNSLTDQYNSLQAQYNLLTMEPRITMTDVVLDHATESWYSDTQTIGASFNLVNDGQVNGFITVRIGGGGTWWGDNTFFVLAGTSVHKEFLITSVPGNLSFTTGIVVVNVSR